MTSSALTDDTGDVYHWKLTDNTWAWEQYAGQKDNIDITSVDYSIDESQVTLTMTVAGTIENSQNIFYYMILVGESGNYQAYYTNENGIWTGTDGFSGEGGLLTDPVIGNTFTATFTINNPSASYDVYGYALEYSNLSDASTSEWWADYAPMEHAPWYAGDDDTGDDDTGDDDAGDDDTGDDDTGDNGTSGGDEGGDDKGTPGFELLTIVAALAVAFIILKRRKQ